MLFTHLFIINVIEIKFGYLSNSWIQENEELKKTLGSTVERSYMHGRKYIAAKVHTNMLYFIGMSRLVESIKGTCELQSNLMASTLDSVLDIQLPGYCAVFLGKSLIMEVHASLHPAV